MITWVIPATCAVSGLLARGKTQLTPRPTRCLHLGDLEKAQSLGLTFWQKRSWCIIHLGSLPPVLLLRTETLDGRLLQKKTPQTKLKTTNDVHPAAVCSGAPPLAITSHEAGCDPSQEAWSDHARCSKSREKKQTHTQRSFSCNFCRANAFTFAKPSFSSDSSSSASSSNISSYVSCRVCHSLSRPFLFSLPSRSDSWQSWSCFCSKGVQLFELATQLQGDTADVGYDVDCHQQSSPKPTS